MIKGCQKKIIHIRNTKSAFFEEAYFILKDGGEFLAAEDDMVKEALKIAQSTANSAKCSKRKKFFAKTTLILAGVSASSLVFGIAMLFWSIAT